MTAKVTAHGSKEQEYLIPRSQAAHGHQHAGGKGNPAPQHQDLVPQVPTQPRLGTGSASQANRKCQRQVHNPESPPAFKRHVKRIQHSHSPEDTAGLKQNPTQDQGSARKEGQLVWEAPTSGLTQERGCRAARSK